MDEKTSARFWSRVDRRRPDECWPWTGTPNRDGYGQFWIDGATRPAHVVMYELLVGPIPAGLDIDHTCHTATCNAHGRDCPHRRCVNPAHLDPTTHRENTLRGRGFTARNAAKPCCPTCNGPYSRTTGGRRRCRPCTARLKRERRASRRALGRT